MRKHEEVVSVKLILNNLFFSPFSLLLLLLQDEDKDNIQHHPFLLTSEIIKENTNKK